MQYCTERFKDGRQLALKPLEHQCNIVAWFDFVFGTLTSTKRQPGNTQNATINFAVYRNLIQGPAPVFDTFQTFTKLK